MARTEGQPSEQPATSQLAAAARASVATAGSFFLSERIRALPSNRRSAPNRQWFRGLPLLACGAPTTRVCQYTAPVTARRPRDFDLSAAVAQPSFTPRTGDLPALLDLLAGAQAAQVERAIARLGPAAVAGVRARLAGAPPTLRARLLRLLGRLGADAELAAQLADDDPRARRQAAVELGKRPGQEGPLL